MKRLVRHYIIETFTLWWISSVTTGLRFEGGVQTLLLTGVALTLAVIIAKPVINILLLPINLITFNLFKWVSSAIALFLVTLIVPGFSVTGFSFAGFSSRWLDIPALNFSGILAFVAFSFALSLTTAIIYWVIK